MNKKRILWITQTALFIAVLISVQAVTGSLGQFVTGSLVNFILISASILGGLASAAVVATVSPIFAFLLIGIPLFPHIIPFIMLGNLTQVTIFCLIAGKSVDNLCVESYIRIIVAAVVAGVAKFIVLWVGVTQIALSIIPNIMPPQVAAMSAMFSWPQLVTAAIGSTIAIITMPALKKAIKLAERE